MLRKVWEKWRAFGEFLGNLFARLVLTVFYFTVFVPFAAVTRLTADYLDIRSEKADLWRPRQARAETIEDMKGQS